LGGFCGKWTTLPNQWLPRLAPLLPLAIPVPLAKGAPGEGYPWQWSVYRWLVGENATIERLADPRQAAMELAQFIAALQRIDPTGWPPSGPDNFFRGVPLVMRDPHTRAAIASLHGTLDPDAVTAAWDTAAPTPYSPACLGAPSRKSSRIIRGDLSRLHGLARRVSLRSLNLPNP
jgi:aminoglycoside phosphotransferase (APT) family kinase protein